MKKYHTEKFKNIDTDSLPAPFLHELKNLAQYGILYPGDTLMGSSINELCHLGLCQQTRKGWYVITRDGVDLAHYLGWIHSK